MKSQPEEYFRKFIVDVQGLTVSSAKYYAQTFIICSRFLWDEKLIEPDVYANIIGLCSNCHRKFHFGKQNEIRDILKPICTARADRFHNSGFTLSKDEFLALAAG